MNLHGVVPPNAQLETTGISSTGNVYANLSPSELVQISLERNLGTLSDTGALMIETGEYTGRSPQDKFTVEDELTRDSVDWNQFNQKFPKDKFEQLRLKMIDYLNGRDIFLQDNLLAPTQITESGFGWWLNYLGVPSLLPICSSSQLQRN